jgi:hypothetical protein
MEHAGNSTYTGRARSGTTIIDPLVSISERAYVYGIRGKLDHEYDE